MTKRILSLVMALCMVLSMVPAFADTAAATEPHVCAPYRYQQHNTVYHLVYCECGLLYSSSGSHEYEYTPGYMTCKFCGYEKECPHTAYAPKEVEGGHIEVCVACGLIKEGAEVEKHEYKREKDANGKWNVAWTEPRECVCGAKEDCAHEAEFIDLKDGTHYKPCTKCGMYVVGVEAHKNFKYEKVNDEAHSYICADCGAWVRGEYHTSALLKDEDGDVKWFTDNEKHWNVCEKCETVVNEKPHNFYWDTDPDGYIYEVCECGLVAATCSGHVSSGTNVATCKKKAICDNCGREYGDLAECNYEPMVNVNSTQHASVCTVCGSRQNFENHEYFLVGSDAICACGAKKVCDHEWKDVPAKSTSCTATEPGHTKGIVCDICGTWKVKPTEIKAGHTWLKEIYLEATCTKDGTWKKTCQVCGAIEFETIHTTEKVAHDLVFVKIGKAPNCVEAGYEIWQCTNPACTYAKGKDEFFKVDIPATGHVLTQIKVDYDASGKLTDELSCIGGIYSYTGCKNCSYMLSDIAKIPNSEHAKHSLSYVGKIAATCTNPAGYLYECTNNDCEYTEIQDKDGKAYDPANFGKYHNVSAGVIEHTTPNSCTEDGTKWYECPACHKQIAPERRTSPVDGKWVDSDEVFTVKATGHKEYVVKVTPATCQEFGYTEYNCEYCNDNYRKVVDDSQLAEHVFVKGKALTEEVCLEKADYQYVCKWCGAVETETKVVNGETVTEQKIYTETVAHKYEMVGAPIKAGETCPDSDWGAGICARCGDQKAYMEFESEEECEYVLMTVPAACEKKAQKGYFCAKCGTQDPNREPEEFGEAPDHAWDNGDLVEVCGYNDVLYYECAACDAEKYVDVDTNTIIDPKAAQHPAASVKAMVVVPGDCQTEGYKYTAVCHECGIVINDTPITYGGDHTRPDDFSTAKNVYTDCTGTYEKFECKVCKLTIDRKLTGEAGKKKDATEHREPVYELITPFNCTESGFGYEACTACGYKAEKPAVIEAQHVWAKDLVVVKAPTCGKDGMGKRVCTVCGQEETYNGKVVYVTIPATQKHTYVEYILDSGVCQLRSYVIYECSVCGGQADNDTLKKAGYAKYLDPFYFEYLDKVYNVFDTETEQTTTAVDVIEWNDLECIFGANEKVEATCTEPAGLAHTCKVCGYKEMVPGSTIGDALGHDKVTTTVKPTCYLDGLKTTTCYRCGIVVAEEVIPATNHDMEDVKNDVRNVAATCKTTGIQVSACKLCGYEELNATDFDDDNHKYETIKEYYAADCKTGASGLVNEKCVYCGKQGVHTVAPTHNYVDTAVKAAPTCDVAGIMVQTCSVCEKATREVAIPKVAHVMITEEQAADCVKDAGIITRCANCDLVTDFLKTGSAKLGHKWSDKVKVAPTCDKNGGYQITCLRGCGETFFYESDAKEDAKLNHKGKTLVKEIEATCVAPAYAIYNCPICKTEITEIAGPVDRLNGHDWKIKNVYNYEPTCAKPGYVDRECALCGVSSNRIWHTPEHTWSDYVYSKDYVYRLCLVCGEVDSIYVSETFAGFVGCTTVYTDPITGNRELRGEHKGLVVKPGKEGTCEEAGQIEDIRCTVCGTVIADGAVIPAHNVTVIEAKAATCTEEGNTAGKYCETCKEYIVKPETIAKVAHTEVEVPAVDATATTAGTTAGKKCSVCGEILEGCEPVAKLGATVKRLCVVRSKAADYREDATSEVVKMLAEGTAVVITGELVNEYYPVEGGYIHMSYITVA